MGSGPVFVGADHGRDRREMITPVHSRHGATDGCRVGHIAHHDLGTGRRVLALSGRKIIEDSDPVPGREQGIGEMRSDEATPARDQIC